MDGIIYKAKNVITGKSYVGQTIQKFAKRKSDHCSLTNNGSKYYFHNALRKHGFENFEWSILEEGKTLEELNLLEPEYIEKIGTLVPNGYNLTSGGKNGRPSEITRAKQRIAKLGKKLTDEHIEKIRLANLGKKRTKEAKEKMRVAQLGKKHTKEAKEKMRVAKLGKKLTDEHKKKIGIAHLKENLTDECRKKLSFAHRGEKNSAANLTEESVLQIQDKLAEGISQRVIAKKFGVHQKTIFNIKHGRTWSHLTGNQPKNNISMGELKWQM